MNFKRVKATVHSEELTQRSSGEPLRYTEGKLTQRNAGEPQSYTEIV